MKKNLHFGRVCAAIMAAACALSANAQVVVHEGGYTDAMIVPAAVTVDGKARITLGKRSREISIYNKNFEKEASIIPAPQSYRYGSITQEATVIVTGATFKSKDPFQYATKYYRYNSGTGEMEPVSATSLEEGLEKLNNPPMSGASYSIRAINGYSFIEFNVTSFYESSFFGTQYPVTGEFFICKDGYLYFTNSLEYQPLYDESSAVWTTTEDQTSIYEIVTVEGCKHVNADEYSQLANSDNDEQLVCTQNFFNDDEEWEYLQYTYSEEPESISTPTIKEYSATSYYDRLVTLSRSVSYNDSRIGFRVLNQSGSVVLSMNFPTPIQNTEPNLWTINGKSYIQIGRGRSIDGTSIIEFYEIDKGTSNVRKVLEYEVPAEEKNADTTIYDLSGRVLSGKPATGVYIQGGKKYLAQ